MAAETGLAKEYKDIFELQGVPAFREFYDFAIFPAKFIYKGMYKPWHVVPAPTVANPFATRNLYRMDVAKAACAEMAGIAWSEAVDIKISQKGSNDDRLSRFVLGVLRENDFFRKMQEHIEQTCALGGGAVKAYVKPAEDDRPPRIFLDYCMADQFVPTSWDNAKTNAAIFVSRKAKGGYYYTRLEWHKWEDGRYVVENELYRSEKKQDGSSDILGIAYPLSEVYPDMAKRVEITDIREPLFVYYRTPTANNVDDNSPLGLSVYGNAYDTLHAIDICYDSLVREFRLGKRRIIVPARLLRTVVDPQTNQVRRYFDPNDEAYEALATDSADELEIKDDAVTLRVEEHVQALNALLSVLCLQLGFSPATFSFDLSGGLKTATEVISENSKTYKTIKNLQGQIVPAVQSLVGVIINLAKLYDMEFEGQSIAALTAGGYEVSITMGDAVLEDAQTRINRGILLLTNGLLSKLTLLTDKRFGIGMTEEQAQQELQRIANESGVPVDAIDKFVAGGVE